MDGYKYSYSTTNSRSPSQTCILMDGYRSTQLLRSHYVDEGSPNCMAGAHQWRWYRCIAGACGLLESAARERGYRSPFMRSNNYGCVTSYIWLLPSFEHCSAWSMNGPVHTLDQCCLCKQAMLNAWLGIYGP